MISPTTMLRPTHIVRSFEGVTPGALDDAGLEDTAAVATDVDGTLMNYHEGDLPMEVRTTLHELSSAGLKLYVVSNAYDGRVDELGRIFTRNDLDITIVTPALVAEGSPVKNFRKPNPAMLEWVKEDAVVPVVMVGDQIFKDILSANRAKVPSILLPRRGHKDHLGVHFQRPLEAIARLALDLPMLASDYPDELRTA